MKIIVDTREQKPLFTGKNVIRRKLDEGDYNLEGLEDYIAVERKEPSDLYGSLVQGHVRFCDEILRARLQGKKFYVVVECSKDDFLAKKWKGSYFTRLNGRVLAKIISKLESEEKYGVIFVWCSGRVEAKQRVKDILINNYLIIYFEKVML